MLKVLKMSSGKGSSVLLGMSQRTAVRARMHSMHTTRMYLVRARSNVRKT